MFKKTLFFISIFATSAQAAPTTLAVTCKGFEGESLSFEIEVNDRLIWKKLKYRQDGNAPYLTGDELMKDASLRAMKVRNLVFTPVQVSLKGASMVDVSEINAPWRSIKKAELRLFQKTQYRYSANLEVSNVRNPTYYESLLKVQVDGLVKDDAASTTEYTQHFEFYLQNFLNNVSNDREGAFMTIASFESGDTLQSSMVYFSHERRPAYSYETQLACQVSKNRLKSMEIRNIRE